MSPIDGSSDRGVSGPVSLGMQLAFLLPAVAFAAIVYFPVTRGYFYLDDFLNLYHIVNDDLVQYLVRENGGHILLTRNTLFYLTFAIVGPKPELFYWSAFITHLLNVVLLFVVVQRLTGRCGIASFGAAFWGISPLNEGALGWYSVYGHAVVGTLLLIILAQASRCFIERRPPSRRLRALWFVLALMAASSFGTGVGVAMALPFMLWLVLYPLVRRPPLLSLLLAVPALYFVLNRLYEYTSGVEAPARLIVGNLALAVSAILKLFVRIAGFGVAEWATGFVLPTPGPLTGWVLSLLAATLALLIAMIMSPAPVRRHLAAAALVVAAAYGTISLGRGALMETAADALVQALTRYHYVGPIGLTLAFCIGLAQLGRIVDQRVGLVVLGSWYIIAAIGYHQSSFVIETHQLERDQTRDVLAKIHQAIDAAPVGATVRIDNVQFPPFPLKSFVPGIAAAFTMFYSDNVIDGRRVEFVETAKHILIGHQGRRISKVLVAP